MKPTPAILALTALATGMILLGGCAEQQATAQPVTFAAHVAPVIAANCLECHTAAGAGYQASGLLMASATNPAEVSYEGLMKGTKFGPVIVPGNSTASTLNILVEGRADPSIKMPHGKAPLAPEQVAILASWVNQGALNN